MKPIGFDRHFQYWLHGKSPFVLDNLVQCGRINDTHTLTQIHDQTVHVHGSSAVDCGSFRAKMEYSTHICTCAHRELSNVWMTDEDKSVCDLCG